IMFGLAYEFARSYGKDIDIDRERLQSMTEDEQMDYVLEQLRAADIIPLAPQVQQMRSSLQWYRSNSRALYKYRAQVYPGVITLYRARDVDSRQHYIRHHPMAGDPTLGWGVLSTEEVQLRDVPGTHTTMIMDPVNLRVLAASMRHEIERVHGVSEATVSTPPVAPGHRRPVRA
ncbi:MAG: hypothetical protein AAFV29_17130, partial [Myxococcota bacterium]